MRPHNNVRLRAQGALMCMFGFLLATNGLAQAVARPDEPARQSHPTPFRLDQSCGVTWRQGQIVGGGATYKAIFGPAGVEFTPALGPDARRSHPLRLSLESIRRGDSVVHVPAEPGLSPRIDGHSAVYDRTPAVAERYEVGPDGVELSYTFAKPLSGTGDIVVRLRIDTDLLQATPPDENTGLVFEAEGLGGVRVGEVWGIDARQRRAGGTVRVVDHGLELRLPATFVDSANYPMVLDPAIGAWFAVGNPGVPARQADVAYDHSNAVYLVVWEQYYSGTDIDIRAQRVDTSGRLVGPVLFLTTGSTSEANPTVASINQTDRFLVCWQQGQAFLGPWDLRAVCVSALDGSVSGEATVATTANDEIEPDAASQSSTATDLALVVYKDVSAASTAIAVASVQCPSGSGAPLVTRTAQLISGSPLFSPIAGGTISKGGGLRHLVTWMRWDSFLGQWSVEATCVNQVGQQISPMVAVASVLGLASTPDVDGDGTDFVLAWQAPETPVSSRNDIWCSAVRWDSSPGLTVLSRTAVATRPNVDETTPAVAWFGPSFAQSGWVAGKNLVAWAEEDTSQLPLLLPWYSLRVVTVAPGTCKPCSSPVGNGWLFGPTPFVMDPQIASRQSGGAITDDGLIVLTGLVPALPFPGQLHGLVYAAFGAGGQVTNIGGGCGSAGTIAPNGAFSLGNSLFNYTLTGSPTATVATGLILGTITTPPIPCGSCAVTPPVTVLPGLRNPFTGVYSAYVPLPCNTALYGGAIRAQWVAAGTPSPCTPQLAFSDRLDCVLFH